jgi:SAM-dependent methyltransferase
MTGWRDIGNGLYRREYADYGAYLAHQASKLDAVTPANLRELDEALYRALVARVPSLPGPRVLCLGARLGGEVRAFRRHGAHAFGVDLNPGPCNEYVVYGDFHHLRFSAGALDAVYTNCLDHAYDLPRLLDEVHLRLDIGGLFIVEAAQGRAEGHEPGSYEALAWEWTMSLGDAIERTGYFKPIVHVAIVQPWPGVHLCYERA